MAHSGLFTGDFTITGVNNLFLAREHILHWKPTLVIADLNSFMQDMNDAQQLSSLLNASERLPFILLQSSEQTDMSGYIKQYPLWATLCKSARLELLAKVINEALSTRVQCASPSVTQPLLTRQEEKVLTLWMEGASNQKIAGQLSINSKTVYTYKRNIRVKLHMDTRFSPFLSLQAVQS
jgi:DNA-binding NarL/FixJ family response regulator